MKRSLEKCVLAEDDAHSSPADIAALAAADCIFILEQCNGDGESIPCMSSTVLSNHCFSLNSWIFKNGDLQI